MPKWTIRKKGGGEKSINWTPMSAIRAFCLECLGWNSGDIKGCTDKLCPLYPGRMGKAPGRKKGDKG